MRGRLSNRALSHLLRNVSGLRGGAGAHSVGEPLAMMIVGAQ
jgi:hypothetical protein